jgi:hypothetical protein
MELSRSTYYDSAKDQSIEEARLIIRIQEICAEWPRYGYRRVTAQLRHEGIIVNHKKVMRLMREHGLTVQPRRRFVATTDSDHDSPIYPALANADKWIHEFTFGTLEQLHDLLGDVIGVKDNKDAIASPDRLESLLQQNGLLRQT